MKRNTFYMLMLLLLVPSIVLAQANGATTCPAIVETALEAADQLCKDVGRNQICYGNVKLDATAQSDTDGFAFEQIGDVEDVVNLASLEVAPLDEETGEWGIAIMRLQASLPDTLPGQNVTFVIFGDVELVNNVTPEQVESGEFSPMQSFYMTTGIGDARCREAPQSGMLVQTPKGIGQINFVLNEVEVQMGSTIFFQAENNRNITLSTLEGSAVLSTPQYSDVYPVVAGTKFNINVLPEDSRIIPIPELPDAYELAALQALPIGLLEREIEIRQPLDKTELAILHERLETGEAICGEDPFPPCENLPESAGGSPCILPNEDGTRPEDADPDQALCELEESEEDT